MICIFAKPNTEIASNGLYFCTTIFFCRVDYDPSEKPANLANSAVLKMLQEEENAKRNGPRSGELVCLCVCECVCMSECADIVYTLLDAKVWTSRW